MKELVIILCLAVETFAADMNHDNKVSKRSNLDLGMYTNGWAREGAIDREFANGHRLHRSLRGLWDLQRLLGMDAQAERRVPLAVERRNTPHRRKDDANFVVQPYPVPVVKKVPYPVETPYPVVKEVAVPYPVDRAVPYPVLLPVDRPVPRPHHVYVDPHLALQVILHPVEVPVPLPYAVPVERVVRVPVPVDRLVPYRVVEQIPFPFRVPVDRPVHIRIPYPFKVVEKVPVTVPVGPEHSIATPKVYF